MEIESTPLPPPRMAIHCTCGLLRLLPEDAKIGNIVNLVPCLKCGSAICGILEENGLRECFGASGE